MQTLLPVFTLSQPTTECNNCHLQSASLTLLPGDSHLVNAPVIVDPDAKPGERLPYVKPADYGEDWQTSGILHDFNNLLAIILSHTNIAMSKLPVDNPGRSNLERAIRATRRAADLSNQLSLSLSRRQDEAAYCELNEIIEEVIELFEPKIAAKAQLEQHLEPDLYAVAVPRLRIQQILMNLILNAVDAIRVLPGRITILTANCFVEEHAMDPFDDPQLPVGHYVVLQVSDTGMGMDQATLNNIFEPYFTTKATGTGIGLSTTLGLVHAYQGIMQVFSTPEFGSTFRVFFPALDA